MSRKKASLFNHPFSAILLETILYLFFFQLITEFVEAVYLFGLLGSSIPPEIGMVLLIFSPLLLFAFRGRISPLWVKILGTVVVLARMTEIMLPTRWRMIVSGIGLAAWLMVLPARLAFPRPDEDRKLFARQQSLALAAALLISITSRAWFSGSDLLAFGMFKLVTWGLGSAAVYMLWQMEFDELPSESAAPANKSRLTAYAFGLVSILIVLYFALTAPQVTARWVGAPVFLVYGILLLVWALGVFIWLKRGPFPSRLGWWLSLAFALAMLFTILPQQVRFPAGPEAGYPLAAPQTTVWQTIPLYLMLVLSPILAAVFSAYLEGILAEQPSLGDLAGAFGAASLYLLVMILAQVFTTVYDYIPVIGPLFRDKFWLVMLVPGLGAALPTLLKPASDHQATNGRGSDPKVWLSYSGVIFVLALAGLGTTTAKQTPPTEKAESLRIFTYNIQQGYDEFGERNFEGQLALLGSKTPDLIGLQECDPARIAGGNTDVVAYFANRLDMYSYYGPSPIAGTFGDALLSRYPIENPQTYYLYSAGEQVAVTESDITFGGKSFKIYVTHLGNSGPMIQVQQLLELIRGQENVIVMGDFNFRPYEEQYALMTAEYDDAFVIAAEQNIPADFDTEERIDHVFVSPGIQVQYLEYLTQPESDHPGLFVEIGW